MEINATFFSRNYDEYSPLQRASKNSRMGRIVNPSRVPARLKAHTEITLQLLFFSEGSERS